MIEQEANVFPMIPPGASLSEPIEGERLRRDWCRHERVQAVTVLLEDRLITLNRAVGLLRRRNLPVRSIAVGPHGDAGRLETHDHDPVRRSHGGARRAAAPEDDRRPGGRRLPGPDGVARELALVKVRAPADRYGELLDVVQLYHAAIVDEAPEAIIVELTGLGDVRAFVPPRARALRDRGGGPERRRRAGDPQPADPDPTDRPMSQRSRARVLRRDADRGRLSGRTFAVIGFGSQGHAHALNLKESGARVVVGLRPGGGSWERARAAGLDVRSVAEAAEAADIIMLLVPDQDMPDDLRQRNGRGAPSREDADVRPRIQHPLRRDHMVAGSKKNSQTTSVRSAARG